LIHKLNNKEKQQTAFKGLLSISGVTSYIKNGNVAVGIGVDGGKPKNCYKYESIESRRTGIISRFAKNC